jgi:predicted RNase H-like HicB family nuclease
VIGFQSELYGNPRETIRRRYHVFSPALKGCHSKGETGAEALQNIREAMEVFLESLAAHNEPISQEEIVIRSVPVAV